MNNRIKKIFFSDIGGIPHQNQWLAFFLPLFLLLMGFVSWMVHPIGETSVLTCDLFHQYAPILAEMRSKILSGQSLFYTWNMGLGTNFWPVLAYNAASPLNLLLLLFPQAYLSDGITVMILLRTGLSGLFFFLLLSKKDGTDNGTALALSTVYALCGYVLAYFWAVMWMDAVVLLPLVILGLWQLIAGKKPRLYVISLFLVIWSNFYFGFFICLFLILFAPVLYLEARQKGVCRFGPLKTGLRFSGYSFLAAGMTSVLLVPTLFALRSTSAATDVLTFTQDLSYTFFDFLSRFLMHADPVIREGFPNVYCGIVILILIPLYAFCHTIPLSRRISSLALAFFLYLSMSSPVLDFFWHGMHYTNQIPHRQAFLLCFLLLYMAGQVLLHIDGLSKKKVQYIGAAVLVYLVLFGRSGETVPNWIMLYGSAAFLILYIIILLYFFASGKAKKRAEKAFLFAVIFEMFFSVEFALAYLEKTEHFTYEPSYGQFADSIADDLAEADGESFSRAVLLPEHTGNDGALYQVKTFSVFASTTSVDYVQFMAALGFGNNGAFEVTADGLTEVSARLLDIRHTVNFTGGDTAQSAVSASAGGLSDILDTFSEEDSSGSDVMYTGYAITDNENVLPVGFYVPTEGIQTIPDASLSPFERTNALLESMGTVPVYVKQSLTVVSASNINAAQDAGSCSIQAAGKAASITLSPVGSFGSRDVLIYVGTDQSITVRVNQTASADTDVSVITPSYGQIIDCGKFASVVGGRMTIQVLFSNAEAGTFPICCYTIDEEALDTATAALAARPLTVTSYDASHLSGTVDFASDGSLFTSIPYDSGWTAAIDGKTVQTKTAYGAMLSVPVSKGTHIITLSYEPPGFFAGFLISLVLAAGFVFLCCWNPYSFVSRKRMGKRIQGGAEEKEERQ